MNIANEFHWVEDLLYYDGPLLSHYKAITRITLSTVGQPDSHEGDMFDGTVEHWRDNYFSNFTIEQAVAFADQEGVELKLYGQDYLVHWCDVLQDRQPALYIWWVYPISEENLEKATALPSSGQAITLREVMRLAPSIWTTDDNRLYRDDIPQGGMLEGDLIQFADLSEDQLPTIDSYITFEPSEEPITLTEPVPLTSPGVAEAVPGRMPGDMLDWPELNTVPAELLDQPKEPWGGSGL